MRKPLYKSLTTQQGTLYEAYCLTCMTAPHFNSIPFVIVAIRAILIIQLSGKHFHPHILTIQGHGLASLRRLSGSRLAISSILLHVCIIPQDLRLGTFQVLVSLFALGSRQSAVRLPCSNPMFAVADL